MNFMQKTKNGYNAMECVSALQKCIRRADERRAMLFALELAHTSKAYFTMMLNRLRIIAHEDIGLANPAAVQFVLTSCNTLADFYEKGGWRIMIGNCVRILCRSPKSREGDHFVWVSLDEWNANGPGEIPDVALDQHTARGKQMGRGIEHFLTEGTVLVTPPPVLGDGNNAAYDRYHDEAYDVKRGKGKNAGQSGQSKTPGIRSVPDSNEDDADVGAVDERSGTTLF